MKNDTPYIKHVSVEAPPPKKKLSSVLYASVTPADLYNAHFSGTDKPYRSQSLISIHNAQY